MSNQYTMLETFPAIYKEGVLVPLEDPGLHEQQAVRLQVVPSQVQITAANARRTVNRFLLDQVSYLMGAEKPSLIHTEDRLAWRVPIVLTSPEKGIVGQVGALDVDAESGAMLIQPETTNELRQNAHALIAHPPSNPASFE